MIDPQPLAGGAGTPGHADQVEEIARTGRTEDQRRSEMLEFREAGLLTEAEFENQMARVHWGIP